MRSWIITDNTNNRIPQHIPSNWQNTYPMEQALYNNAKYTKYYYTQRQIILAYDVNKLAKKFCKANRIVKTIFNVDLRVQ